MKQVAGTLKLELAQFDELQAFSQFASDLDAATQKQLARGQRLRDFKTKSKLTNSVEEQIAIIYAGVKGYLDTIPTSKVKNLIQNYVIIYELMR